MDIVALVLALIATSVFFLRYSSDLGLGLLTLALVAQFTSISDKF